MANTIRSAKRNLINNVYKNLMEIKRSGKETISLNNITKITSELTVTMTDYSQSRKHDKRRHPRKELTHKAAIEAINLFNNNDFESTTVGRLSGYQYKELNLFNKNKHHQYRDPDDCICTGNDMKHERLTPYPVDYQYTEMSPDGIQSKPAAVNLKIEDVSKHHSNIRRHEINIKNKKNTDIPEKNLRRTAESKFIGQSFNFISAKPRITPLNSYSNIKLQDSFHTVISNMTSMNFLQSSTTRGKYKNTPKCKLEQSVKLQRNRLKSCLSSNCIAETVVSDSLSETCYDQSVCSLTKRLSVPKDRTTPYDKTVVVYRVYDQTDATKRKPGVNLASNASFNVKFYKSMGDGQQMFGNGSPYMQLPRNYSPTNVARGGRDEDGCICVYIPQEPVYDYMQQEKDISGDNFLKRYFRVLLKEQKRCICGKKKRPDSKPCRYDICRVNRFGGGGMQMPGGFPMPQDYNVGCQCKYDFRNPMRSFRANDAAVQCKCREKRERRSDDIFRKDRGTTCCAPICSQKENENNNLSNDNVPNAPSGKLQGKRDKNTVNVGSNFNFQLGFYKRCIDTNPKEPTFGNPKTDGYYASGYDSYRPQNRDDCPCYDSDDNPYREPKSGSILSVLLRSNPPRVQCRSSSMNSTWRGRDEGICSYASNQALSPCVDGPSPSCCMSKSPSAWSQFLKQFERSDLCCNNEPKSRCKPKKHKAVPCRCAKKPVLVGCTDKKNVGCCSTTNLRNSTKDISCDCYTGTGINVGCNCSKEPTLVLQRCTKKKKTCCSSSIATCCCKRSGNKKSKKIAGAGCQCKEKRKSKGCCCDAESPSLLDILFKREEKEERCCQCNDTNTSRDDPKLNIIDRLSRFCQLKGQKCACSSKSGEFDYKKVLNSTKLTKQLKKQGGNIRRCECGDINVKKVLSSLLEPAEQKQQTKAQQCGCGKGDFDFKKTFGRLLLYNTVQKPICCTSVSYDQNSRSVGIGEEDYRKIPPYRYIDNSQQEDTFAVNRFMNKLIKPETCCTRMHYSAFNPLNQAEAGIQNSGRIGPDDITGATICKNQGSCVPKSKPMTLKDCENAAVGCPALQADDNRKAVRLGSSCSFSLEFYRGMPPPKAGSAAGPPPCVPRCTIPCPAPCSNVTTTNATVCPSVKQPCKKTQPTIKKTFQSILGNPKNQLQKSTCQKCNKCVKIPIIKKGFANILLRDKKPLKGARTCQKTNTLQPNRKIITRKPTGGKAKGGLGASTKCDPYVCLKRINERKCCR